MGLLLNVGIMHIDPWRFQHACTAHQRHVGLWDRAELVDSVIRAHSFAEIAEELLDVDAIASR